MKGALETEIPRHDLIGYTKMSETLPPGISVVVAADAVTVRIGDTDALADAPAPIFSCSLDRLVVR